MKIAQITLVIMATAMLFACNQTKEKRKIVSTNRKPFF